MPQNFTSAATAVNGKAGKLPAIYKKLNLNGLIVLDIGCGAEVKHINNYCAENNCIWYGIDPYNQTAEHNTEAEDGFVSDAVFYGAEGNRSLVISSNVLNVIDDEGALEEVVEAITSWHCGYAVTVYEGNGSGIGKQTGVDQWQRNEKLKEYLKYFPSDAVIRKGIITNVPELVK